MPKIKILDIRNDDWYLIQENDDGSIKTIGRGERLDHIIADISKHFNLNIEFEEFPTDYLYRKLSSSNPKQSTAQTEDNPLGVKKGDLILVANKDRNFVRRIFHSYKPGSPCPFATMDDDRVVTWRFARKIDTKG